jgi:hypothetical protein
VSSQSFEFSCSLASLAAHAVAQPRYLRSVSCRCRVAVELVSLVSRHDMGGRCVGEVAGLPTYAPPPDMTGEGGASGVSKAGVERYATCACPAQPTSRLRDGLVTERE